RIYPKGTTDDPNPGLDPAKPETLLAALDHPNLLWRLHAQRLIVEGGKKELAEKLAALVTSGGRASSHAIHALAGLGAMDDSLLDTARKSDVRAIQRAAIHVATPVQIQKALVTDGTVQIKDDRELAEALVSLSRLPGDKELGVALFNLITKEEARITEEVVLKDAWVIAANRHAVSVTNAAKAAGFTGEVAEKREM